jgi:hypothetical protein
MTATPFPERPNLEQLKHQAKDLLRAARDRDAGALSRFKILPAFASATDASLSGAALALHDAQSVIAREQGFESWNALREHVEDRTLAFDAAVDQFLEAATSERPDRAERLLELHPEIARANLQTRLSPPRRAASAAGSRCITSATRPSARDPQRVSTAWSRSRGV